MEVQLRALLTLALEGGEWSATRPGRFINCVHWVTGWLRPIAGLADLWKDLTFPANEPTLLGRPAPTQSAHRVTYPESTTPSLLAGYERLIEVRMGSDDSKILWDVAPQFCFLVYLTTLFS